MKKNTTPLPIKIVYTALAVVLTLLGIVGLVMPVLPGVLFLIMALFLLGRVSSRLNMWMENQPFVHKFRYRVKTMGRLDWKGRIEFTGWLIAEAVSNFVRTVHNRMASHRVFRM